MRSGLGLKATVEHRKADGQLVAIQRSYDRWKAYQGWRAKWCEEHRNEWAVKGFREGRITPLTLGFAIIIRMMEVLNGIRR